MLESAGVPVSGETILVTSGVLVQQGYLDLGDAIIFGLLGAMVGDQIGYRVGRGGARPFILRWGRYLLIPPERLERAEDFFERHGEKAVFLARFVAGLRGAGRRDKPDALEDFPSLQHPGGSDMGDGLRPCGLLPRWKLRPGGEVDRPGDRSALHRTRRRGGALSAFQWARIHPERLKRAYELTGGRYIYKFLRSPAGLWLRRRFSPQEVYSLALTVGLVFTGLFSWAFGGIVEDVLNRDSFV